MKKKSLFAVVAGVAALAGAAAGTAWYLKKKQDEAVETVDLEILDDQLEQDAEDAAEDVEEAMEDAAEDVSEDNADDEEPEEAPVEEPMEEDEEPEDAEKIDE